MEAKQPSLELLSARRHQRYNCNIPVSWRLLERNQAGESRLINLGLGGACVELPKVVTGPETLQITIPLEDGTMLMLKGRTIWSSGDDESQPCRTGIQFIRMDDPERRALDALLRRLMKSD